ncbi:cytochrome P450 4c3-like isoform X2 [Plodia interpunctella]|uniref:cytochrome P450 4c3-like isoform X2 n=1 Tax=Plodia interpunctella TaxID=58824 RepID=UPI002368BD08|nr:cytochrome P450 4c3-like isoform X2 [Plodia interpunctella]
MIILGVVVLAVGVYWLYFSIRTQHMEKLTAALPSPPSLPLLGNAMMFIGNTEKMLHNLEYLADLAHKHKGCVKIWLGPKLYIAIGNPEDAQLVLENCLDKDGVYRFLRAWLGHGLFVAPVGLWKTHRKVLLPVFHNKVVEEYLGVIGQQAGVLVGRLADHDGQGEFDVLKYITACTLDIVFETAMGERMDVQHTPDTPYLRARHTVISILNMRLFKVWLQPDCLFNLTSYAKQQRDNIDLTHKFTDEVVKKKRQEYENKKNQVDNDQTKEAGCGVTLPAGAGAVIGSFAIHKSKAVWGANADDFDPDRFLPERSVGRHPAAFLPFSFGSRNCIGRNFGMLIMKSIISSIVRAYKINAKPIDRLKIEVLLFPTNGHQIMLRRR